MRRIGVWVRYGASLGGNKMDGRVFGLGILFGLGMVVLFYSEPSDFFRPRVDQRTIRYHR